MNEIAPGIFHWTAYHEPINGRVSSYLIAPSAAVIDPKLPDNGWQELPTRPEVVLLTSGHHVRDAADCAQEFEAPVRASPQAARHIGDRLIVDTVAEGEQAAPGITGRHVGVLCEDEGVLHITVGGGALAIADGIHRLRGELAFFSDDLLGDDPDRIKDGLRRAYARLLELDFAHLLFAHGEPLVDTGKAALASFVDGAGDAR